MVSRFLDYILTDDEADQVSNDCSTLTKNVCSIKRLAVDLSAANFMDNADLIMLFLDPLKTPETFHEFLETLSPKISVKKIDLGYVGISKCDALFLSSELAQRLMDRPISANFPELTFRKNIEYMVRLALTGIDIQLESINFRPLLLAGNLNWKSPMLKSLAILHNLNHKSENILPQLPHIDTNSKQAFFAMNLSIDKARGTIGLDYSVLKSIGESPVNDFYSLPALKNQSAPLLDVHESNKVCFISCR